MPYTFKLDKYSMLLTTHAGEVKTRTFREAVPYEDYRDSLFDFIFTHIGQTFIFDDFSPCTIMWNYDGQVFRKHFDTLDALKAWYVSLT